MFGPVYSCELALSCPETELSQCCLLSVHLTNAIWSHHQTTILPLSKLTLINLAWIKHFDIWQLGDRCVCNLWHLQQLPLPDPAHYMEAAATSPQYIYYGRLWSPVMNFSWTTGDIITDKFVILYDIIWASIQGSVFSHMIGRIRLLSIYWYQTITKHCI